jgi:hypothetical protein
MMINPWKYLKGVFFTGEIYAANMMDENENTFLLPDKTNIKETFKSKTWRYKKEIECLWPTTLLYRLLHVQ